MPFHVSTILSQGKRYLHNNRSIFHALLSYSLFCQLHPMLEDRPALLGLTRPWFRTTTRTSFSYKRRTSHVFGPKCLPRVTVPNMYTNRTTFQSWCTRCRSTFCPDHPTCAKPIAARTPPLAKYAKTASDMHTLQPEAPKVRP